MGFETSKTQADEIINPRRALRFALLFAVAIFLATPSTLAQLRPFENGMVVSENRIATLVGLSVLKEGGNAVDAAVAMGFAMAVTFPRAGNIGGGGFMLIHFGKSGQTVSVDYREKAPIKATKQMFLDEKGEIDTRKARSSVYSSGVPGTVAGLSLALAKYGSISLEKALAPAIRLAEEGFPIDAEFRKSLLESKQRMMKSSENMDVFFKNNGEPPREGEILKQKNLAWSLKQIRKNGPKAFYEGAIAKKIAAYMKHEGGLITERDLKSYEAVIREPVAGSYRGYRIYSMPPPSSGGVHLIQMLNILENYPLSDYGHNSARYVHVLSEAMKLAYADRSEYLGDPDFSIVPTKQLISKKYAKHLAKRINFDKATPSEIIKPGKLPPPESGDTTHFTVVDRFGNVVSNTYTLNFAYGSGLSVPGTGILLNNEMDDFSAKPGVPNAYGLIGNERNSIASGKRMLSSMTPTIVLKEGNFVLATGAKGGSRIITSTLQIVLNVIDHKMNVLEATLAPRIHHQWLPDTLYMEEGAGAQTEADLRKKGHSIKRIASIASAQSVSKVGGMFYGAADPRRKGSTAAGY